MRVLITGGAGFIGFHLASFHARRGDEVWLLDSLFKSQGHLDPELENLLEGNVQLATADLTQPLTVELPETFDIVYHLAAINGTRLFYEIPYTVARTNLLATINLLDALETRQIGRLLYSSSSEVYADSQSVGLLKVPTDETIPVVFSQPTNVRFSYGTTKFMGEFLCQQFGLAQGIDTSVVRYHNIYGPRMGKMHVVPEFIARLRAGEQPFRLFGGDETRAFCYVEDAVAATFAVAVSAGCTGEVLHIGDPREEVRIDALARLLMEIVSGTISELVDDGGRSGSVARRCPDIGKLQRLTGWLPQTSLREGLQRTAAWYLKADHSNGA